LSLSLLTSQRQFFVISNPEKIFKDGGKCLLICIEKLSMLLEGNDEKPDGENPQNTAVEDNLHNPRK